MKNLRESARLLYWSGRTLYIYVINALCMKIDKCNSFDTKSSNRNHTPLLYYSSLIWFVIWFIISYLHPAKVETFDRNMHNGKTRNATRRDKIFHEQHQPRCWNNRHRWTFGADIIKVDTLHAEIPTTAASSKNEFRSGVRCWILARIDSSGQPSSRCRTFPIRLSRHVSIVYLTIRYGSIKTHLLYRVSGNNRISRIQVKWVKSGRKVLYHFARFS